MLGIVNSSYSVSTCCLFSNNNMSEGNQTLKKVKDFAEAFFEALVTYISFMSVLFVAGFVLASGAKASEVIFPRCLEKLAQLFR
jgi:hypothetical protein